MTTNKDLSREEVFEMIFNSYIYGNLGLFIGAGFSKAVINESYNKPLSWGELIQSVCEELLIYT